MSVTDSVYDQALDCLSADDPDDKSRRTERVAGAWQAGRLQAAQGKPVETITQAGHPERPRLVHPRDLSRRSFATKQGRAALVHAFTHIEFNAINLAWDAVYRFRTLPVAFYTDWIQVAVEEAYHFRLLRSRLRELGFDYGDFPAHNGLWDMAVRTAHDPLVRMAVVARSLEARGLDVTPGMMERFRAIGDRQTVEILDIILRDEVAHVAAGTCWFRFLCAQQGLDPETQYFGLLEDYLAGEVRGPLHYEARRQAGFSDNELERLKALCRRA